MKSTVSPERMRPVHSLPFETACGLDDEDAEPLELDSENDELF
jgi:hypothetical protein